MGVRETAAAKRRQGGQARVTHGQMHATSFEKPSLTVLPIVIWKKGGRRVTEAQISTESSSCLGQFTSLLCTLISLFVIHVTFSRDDHSRIHPSCTPLVGKLGSMCPPSASGWACDSLRAMATQRRLVRMGTATSTFSGTLVRGALDHHAVRKPKPCEEHLRLGVVPAPAEDFR